MLAIGPECLDDSVFQRPDLDVHQEGRPVAQDTPGSLCTMKTVIENQLLQVGRPHGSQDTEAGRGFPSLNHIDQILDMLHDKIPDLRTRIKVQFIDRQQAFSGRKTIRQENLGGWLLSLLGRTFRLLRMRLRSVETQFDPGTPDSPLVAVEPDRNVSILQVFGLVCDEEFVKRLLLVDFWLDFRGHG